MATEKNEYGFRMDSKPAQICEMGKEWFEAATNQSIMELLGVNAGYASNLRKLVAEATGWLLNGAKVERAERKTSNIKVKGCLPRKVMYRIAKELGLDLEVSDEPGWNEWKLVSDNDPDFEGFSMVRLAGGEESDGGKSYRQWIDSNRAADQAVKDAAEKAADPMFQLKEKLSRYAARIVERDIEIKNLKEELENAKRNNTGGRGPRMGGELTAEGLKLLKQRFHPDKQNGNDPALYTSVMQWLNAITL